MVVIEVKQVPEISVQIFKDNHHTVSLFFRLSHKLYPLRSHRIVVSPKVIGVEK